MFRPGEPPPAYPAAPPPSYYPQPLEAAGGTEGEGEDAALLRRLRGGSYPKGVSPLYALMVAFEAPIGDAAPFEGAYVANSRALRWITRDSSKPGRARPPLG